MRYNPWLLPCVALIVLYMGNSSTALASLPEDFDQLVEKVRSTFSIPGLAITVVKDGKVVLARGYGVRKLGGKPVNERTRFGIASNTKAFTATALALLVDDGLISWDTPVVEYLPMFALSDPYVTANLTIRDLLAHNSGLALGAGDLLWWPETDHSLDETIRRLRYLPLASSFRQGYAYDNVLYGVAGKVIEEVSGLSYVDFVSRRILNPLGMTDSMLHATNSSHRGNLASPHAEIDGSLQVIDAFESSKTRAAGGLQSSARDMGTWLKTQLAHGRINEKERLFSDAASEALWSIVTPMPTGKPPCDIEPLGVQFRGYALGFTVQDYRGNKMIRHGGGLPGFVSDVLMVPALDLGIVIMTNQQVQAGITVLTSTLLDHILGVNDTDWLPAVQRCHEEKMEQFTSIKDKVRAAREHGTQPLPVDRVTGRYRDAWYGDIEIRQRDDDTLELDFTHTPALIGDMEHWHHNTWIVRWHNAPLPPNNAFITFTLDAQGKVISAKMEPVSPFTDFSYDFTHLLLKPVQNPG